MPVSLLDVVWMGEGDFSPLVPEGVTGEFTAKEFGKAAGLSLGKAQTGLNVLRAVGAVELAGKRGRAYLYRKAEGG